MTTIDTLKRAASATLAELIEQTYTRSGGGNNGKAEALKTLSEVVGNAVDDSDRIRDTLEALTNIEPLDDPDVAEDELRSLLADMADYWQARGGDPVTIIAAAGNALGCIIGMPNTTTDSYSNVAERATGLHVTAAAQFAEFAAKAGYPRLAIETILTVTAEEALNRAEKWLAK